MVKVILEDRELEVEGVRKVADILKKLNLPSTGYIVAVNGKLVTEEDEVPEDGEVKIIEVWSGG